MNYPGTAVVFVDFNNMCKLMNMLKDIKEWKYNVIVDSGNIIIYSNKPISELGLISLLCDYVPLLPRLLDNEDAYRIVIGHINENSENDVYKRVWEIMNIAKNYGRIEYAFYICGLVTKTKMLEQMLCVLNSISFVEVLLPLDSPIYSFVQEHCSQSRIRYVSSMKLVEMSERITSAILSIK